MNTFSLNGCWKGECFNANGIKKFDFSGIVPGCVHTDLAGKHIPEDIFYRNNADECQWIENCDWRYTKVFMLDEVPEGAMLICDVTSDGEIIDRAFYKSGTLPIVPSDGIKIVSKTEKTITVTTDKYIHAVEPDGEFVFDDNYFSLLPNEKRTVTFRPIYEAKNNEMNISGYTVKLF